jgi:NADH-quinone oxidoreductase subunit L
MVVTAVLTMAYSLRAWLLVFFGEGRLDPAAEVHEAPPSMRVPLYLLAVPTVFGGLVVADPAALLGPAYDVELFHVGESLAMTALVAATAVVVLLVWRARGPDLWPRLVLPHPPVDRVYDLAVVRPVRRLAQLVRAGDRDVIDGYADGAGASARGLGGLLRLAQTGNVQTYLMVVVVGAAAVAVVAGAVA